MLQFLHSRRFIVQLLLVFGLFTLGTTIGVGIPVTLLLERQTERQLHALLDQSEQTTYAIYQNKLNQLENLSLLITGRPTLNQMLSEREDALTIRTYLEEIIENSGVNGLLVCSEETVVSGAGDEIPASICQDQGADELIVADKEVWLISSTTLPVDDIREYHVVVGQRVDDVLEEFSDQSGLEYILYQEGQRIAATRAAETDLEVIEFPDEMTHYQTLTVNWSDTDAVTYMAALMPLSDNQDFLLVGLLNVDPYLSHIQQLRTIIFVTLFAVGLVSTVVAIILSRRVSDPINRLALAAVNLREGNLDQPLSSSSKVWEINQLTNSLEDARVSLKHSLDQLRTEKAWIENLLNSIVEGLLTIDEKRRITFVSEAVEHLVGLNAIVILGRSIDEIFAVPPGEEPFSHQVPGLNQSRRIPVVLVGQETLLAVSASAFVPLDAGNASLALVIRDVTDEERIHRLMGEFMANITHEFRTPLAALAASVELLLDQLPSLSMPEIEQLLNALNIGVINLQSLIDNLIETASIEAGRFKVNPRPVEVNLIIHDAVNTIQPIAEKYGVNLIYSKKNQSPLVNADVRRTSQALVNLLSNAIKNSPEHGNIEVTTLIIGQNVLVEVRDEGEGVASSLRSQIFNRFIAAAPEDESVQIGLGLGLSVVKAIIEAQQGDVGFRESESGGALFWFTLPLAKGLTQ